MKSKFMFDMKNLDWMSVVTVICVLVVLVLSILILNKVNKTKQRYKRLNDSPACNSCTDWGCCDDPSFVGLCDLSTSINKYTLKDIKTCDAIGKWYISDNGVAITNAFKNLPDTVTIPGAGTIKKGGCGGYSIYGCTSAGVPLLLGYNSNGGPPC
jgi:hypothetical protein